MADENATLAVSAAQLKRVTDKIKQEYIKTVNGVAGTDGAVTLNPDAIPYGDNSNVKAALDAINDKINYVKINIDSLTNDVGTVEKGVKVRAVTVSFAFNTQAGAVLKAATLNGTALTADELKAGKKAFSYPAPTGNAADPALVKDTTFTVVATDSHDASVTKTTGVYFQNKKYWGVGNVAADAIDSAFILGLGGNAFASNFRGDFTANSGADQHIYFAFPTAWGTPKFVVGGFEGGFVKEKTLDFTNASGYTESYDVWKTGNTNLGNTTVTVG